MIHIPSWSYGDAAVTIELCSGASAKGTGQPKRPTDSAQLSHESDRPTHPRSIALDSEHGNGTPPHRTPRKGDRVTGGN